MITLGPFGAAAESTVMPATGSGSSEPSLTLTPESGVAGRTVTLVGEGLHCNASADGAGDIVVRSEDRDELFTGTTTDGRFEAEFTVPRTTTPGPYTITAQCVSTGESVSEDFTVVPPAGAGSPLPTSEPTEGSGDPTEGIGDPLESQLDDGVIVFNKPDRMRVGEPVSMVVRVASTDIEEIYQDFEGLPGEVRNQPTLVSRVMRVALVADSGTFTIESLSSEDQLVLDQAFTEWSWIVTPRRSGSHTLTIRASVLLMDPSHGEKPIDRIVVNERVRVDINPAYSLAQFASSNWQWLWTVIVIPVGAALLRTWRRRPAAGRIPAETASTGQTPNSDAPTDLEARDTEATT